MTSFPEGVVSLLDPASGVILRAPAESDIDAIVEQCRDPGMIAWTRVPDPYQRSDARDFLVLVAEGWQTGSTLSWAIEHGGRYAGTIDLRLAGDGSAEIGFGLHPAARGRGVMSSAVRLVRDHGLDTLGLDLIRWRAKVGNWPSRRVAAAAGFVFDGTVRRLLFERGGWHDGWMATITADDPRTPQPRLAPVPLGAADGIRLRPFRTDDVERIVEACSDPRTRHWLVSLPQPYTADDARRFLGTVAEMELSRTGIAWCVTDRSDLCLGSISLEGLGGYDKRGEIGYWSHPAARGRGVITEATRLVTAWAEASGLTDTILIRCAGGNTASRSVPPRCGYREVGTLLAAEPLGDGDLDDLVIYARP